MEVLHEILHYADKILKNKENYMLLKKVHISLTLYSCRQNASS